MTPERHRTPSKHNEEVRADWTNGKLKKAIRICRCMISVAIDSTSATGDTCVGGGLVGGGLVGEGGKAMRVEGERRGARR